MKRMLFLFLVLVIILYNYGPLTKNSYLARYERFIAQVKAKRDRPGFNWEKNDKMFNRFSQRYYKRFEKKMTISEKSRCLKFEMQYHLWRVQNEAIDKKNKTLIYFKDIQKKAENYLKNDMNSDIAFLKKEIDTITGSIINTLKQASEKIIDNGSSTSP